MAALVPDSWDFYVHTPEKRYAVVLIARDAENVDCSRAMSLVPTSLENRSIVNDVMVYDSEDLLKSQRGRITDG